MSIYILYTPRFRGSSEGARGSSEGARGASRNHRGSTGGAPGRSTSTREPELAASYPAIAAHINYYNDKMYA